MSRRTAELHVLVGVLVEQAHQRAGVATERKACRHHTSFDQSQHTRGIQARMLLQQGRRFCQHRLAAEKRNRSASPLLQGPRMEPVPPVEKGVQRSGVQQPTTSAPEPLQAGLVGREVVDTAVHATGEIAGNIECLTEVPRSDAASG